MRRLSTRPRWVEVGAAALFFSACLLLLSACGDDAPAREADQPPQVVTAEIEGVRTPDPLLVGSPIEVTLGIGRMNRDVAELVIRRDGLEVARVAPTNPLEFRLDAATFTALGGAGLAVVELALADAVRTTEPIAATWTIAADLPVELTGVSSSPAYYGQPVVLVGSGFVSPNEGEVTARFEGTFTPNDGEPEPILVDQIVRQAERFDRGRGVVRIPVGVGDLREGEVTGELSLQTVFTGGGGAASEPLPVSFGLLPPEVFRVEPETVALGQPLRFLGGGFVEEPGVTMLIRLEGHILGPASALPIEGLELVMDAATGDSGEWIVRAVEASGRLVADQLGVANGTFEGTATVTATNGVNTLTGGAAPIEFTLGGVRQVVWLSLLPGFYDSLDLFGLGAAAGAIEAKIEARIDAIFDGYAVDVRLGEPDDFDPNHVARVEIGGPDPNGIGLFGFDNTPGKDVGNLRLFDVIGGANFESQADGYPGYGGVFIESMLWWAENPPLDGPRPNGAPPADPLFEEVFAPMFARPATPSEVRGQGDPDRVAEVGRAVNALANLVGETVAHELGHSFGLAQPDSETSFHNAFDSPGCLMDAGPDRPFAERAGLTGEAPTTFCAEAPAYLNQILPQR